MRENDREVCIYGGDRRLLHEDVQVAARARTSKLCGCEVAKEGACLGTYGGLPRVSVRSRSFRTASLKH